MIWVGCRRSVGLVALNQYCCNTVMNFQTTYRRSQGEFRNASTTISAAGRSPSDDKAKRNPHLLTLGSEIENLMPSLRGADGAVEFFSRRKIKWWKSARSGDDCARDTPTRNLASSQVACVNFLLPLADNEEALAAILTVMDAVPLSVEPLMYNGLNSTVELEWVGLRGSLEGSRATRGANVTSCDALLVARTTSGRCAYLIEWKCCEEYKGKKPMGEGNAGEIRRGRYQHLYDLPESSFNKQVPMDDLLWEPFYQLMRLFLLGDKMVREGEFGINDFKVVVVCPSDNVAYRNLVTSPSLKARFATATEVAQVMRQAIRYPEKFQIISQSELLNGLRKSACPARAADHLKYHYERYGW